MPTKEGQKWFKFKDDEESTNELIISTRKENPELKSDSSVLSFLVKKGQSK